MALLPYLAAHGRPIAYDHLAGDGAQRSSTHGAAPYPLVDRQTVYATEPGSAEMPSAGRPVSERVLVALIARGITVAPLVLHAGVSSQEKHEPPMPERFAVPPATARLVNSARAAGARVVAVGTTVVRALETVAATDGGVSPGHGWTDLVLGRDRPARAVTGLISGLHEPEASHLSLLEAVAGADLVGRVYAAAVRERYLWHEFGDSTLLLP
jgi:S-adenosylmethionine:tRNA ribosyltransferase-isomerase